MRWRPKRQNTVGDHRRRSGIYTTGVRKRTIVGSGTEGISVTGTGTGSFGGAGTGKITGSSTPEELRQCRRRGETPP